MLSSLMRTALVGTRAVSARVTLVGRLLNTRPCLNHRHQTSSFISGVVSRRRITPKSSPFSQQMNHRGMLFPLSSQNRFLATRPEKLHQLYEEADMYPKNAQKQEELFQVLVEEDPDTVISRFESKLYSLNEECAKYYIEALVVSKRLRAKDLAYLFTDIHDSAPNLLPSTQNSYNSFQDLQRQQRDRMSQRGSGGPPTSSREDTGFSLPPGDEDNPLTVEIKEPSFRQQFWRLLRTVVVLLLFLSAASQIMEERSLGGLGQQQVRPEVTDTSYSFDDVQGADEAKEELMSVVEFLKNPQKFTRLGGRLPKGVLLMGPPGTGKTLLARAVAGEAGVPFFYCSGSEFDEMYVGVGARRVRDLFEAAKKRSPCIIFMDEIDAVGGKRHSRDQQYLKMTLNQLLVELDGFDQKDAVIVIGATNFPESLDPALIRPGRFDTHVKVPLPDVRGREAILKAHSRKVQLQNESDLWAIARGTVGFSGAELANVINQAALEASRLQRDTIDLQMLEWAKDKILMGAERKKAVITDKDRKVTAYHEGGHALCALYAKGAVPVYKATIVPRGNALGMVTQLPIDDTNSLTREEMMARLIVCMGGRAAEEKIFGKNNVTSGASSDVEQATRLAKTMVMKYGLSDKVGPMMFENEDNISEATRYVIETETKALLDNAMKSAMDILSLHEKEHQRLAEALLEFETLTADEMRLVIKGKNLNKKH
eukprot:m.92560 g.92560  ORF g.92560 m.92560 type:complete len:711 (-) comp12361_c0_seq1:245-2377(-)